ncbi:alanine racemase [Steroidobacter sp. S1-65]|uniref:Alanine racemase n=1 Tax=Steroidobacter gossypii TaxID=2805490 RepID=A0ABS1X6C8_9GAMM|nr:alanine racemase [Steroidobacter gossypii]MBM0108779.1 alanine racemase [Steroidobacter gossypii]
MSFPVATIDASALRNNLAVVRRMAPRSRVIAVVKANGYGHGMIRVARALADADGLGVARLADAVALREAGITQRILLLEGVFGAEQFALAAKEQCEIVVHSPEQLDVLEQFSGSHRFVVWLKLNSGMNRLGFRVSDFAAAHARLRRCSSVSLIRVMTHLSSSEERDDPDSWSPHSTSVQHESAAADRGARAHVAATSRRGEITVTQLQIFDDAVAPLGHERSVANSAAVIAWPESHQDWVRPGLMLYGMSPMPGKTAADFGLRPAMTLSTQLIAIQNIGAGESVGYNGIWRASRASRIGIAAIGYGDGFPRSTRNGAPVLVAGREASIAGRVSMDMIGIDVTDLPNAKPGDEVIVWGSGLPAERLAPYADTTCYELVCRVTSRVPLLWRE